jgi:hypothetical protein
MRIQSCRHADAEAPATARCHGLMNRLRLSRFPLPPNIHGDKSRALLSYRETRRRLRRQLALYCHGIDLQQRGNGDRVADLTAPDKVDRIAERHASHREHFLRVELGAVDFQVPCEEAGRALVGDRGRSDEAEDLAPALRRDPDSFAQLALGGIQWRFVGRVATTG